MNLKTFSKKEFKFIAFILLLLSSCNYSLTKEQYLSNYNLFVDDVKQHYSQYDESKWKEKDKEFKKFNEELYSKFKNQLTSSEETRILRFDFVYNLVRGNLTLADLVSGKYNHAIGAYAGELTSVLKEVVLMQKDIKDIISIDLLNKLLKSTP